MATAAVVVAAFDGDVRGLPDDTVEWLESHPAPAREPTPASPWRLERNPGLDSELL